MIRCRSILISSFLKQRTNAGRSDKEHSSRFIHNARVCCAGYFSEVQKVKKLDKKLVELNEEDLSQQQVKGSGAGGQKTNKTANCIVLRHEPTGLHVRVHDSRSVLDNIEIARARLRMKVDIHMRGDDSVLVQEEKQKMSNKQHRKIQAEKRLEGKARLKALLDNENDDFKY